MIHLNRKRLSFEKIWTNRTELNIGTGKRLVWTSCTSYEHLAIVIFILICENRDGMCFNQCDQMARLFLQYLAIYNNENLPNSKNISKIRFKSLQVTEWTLTILPKYIKLHQISEVSPNLVTLVSTYIVSRGVHLHYKNGSSSYRFICILAAARKNSSLNNFIRLYFWWKKFRIRLCIIFCLFNWLELT